VVMSNIENSISCLLIKRCVLLGACARRCLYIYTHSVKLAMNSTKLDSTEIFRWQIISS